MTNMFMKHSVPCKYVISFKGLLIASKILFLSVEEKFVSKYVKLSLLIMSIMDKVRKFCSIKQLMEFLKLTRVFF